MLFNLIYPPLIVREVVHQVHIHLPYDEQYKLSKDRKEAERKESNWIEMLLPVTPRVGEVIDLPFVQETGMNILQQQLLNLD